MKKLLVFASLCVTSMLSAQSAQEALETFNRQVMGDSRAMATMNSLDALGAQPNSLLTNPAGLANFRRSEIGFSVMRYGSQIDTEAGGFSLEDQGSSKFRLSNFSLLITTKPRKNKSWKQSNFGLSIQKTDIYKTSYSIEAKTPGTITESFLERATGRVQADLDPFYEGLAFGTALISDVDNPGQYFIDFPENSLVNKYYSFKNDGVKNHVNFSYAANYKNKLLIGANLALSNNEQNYERRYIEDDVNDEIPVFEELEFIERGEIEGDGVSLGLGLIYNLTHSFRAAYSFQSPTWHTTTVNSFTSDLNYNYFENGALVETQSLSPRQEVSYDVRSPWRHRMGLAYLFSKKGFISASAEYVDFGGIKYDFGDSREVQDIELERNAEISDLFSASWTIGVGIEYVPIDRMRVRGGWGLVTSPADYISNTNRFSLGAGWRWDNFYIDLAYLNQGQTVTEYPYRSADFAQTEITRDVRNHLINLSFGIKL